MTVRQMTTMAPKNAAALRRRVRQLRAAGLIVADTRLVRGHRGRPESVISLSEDGVALLRRNRILDARTPTERVLPDLACSGEHHLVINDFRAQIVEMQRLMPQFSVRFLSPTSPFVARRSHDASLVCETFQSRDGRRVQFTPDGVFALTHAGTDKTLLFFLEVDMGTESRGSRRNPRCDLWQKISKYQAFYGVTKYKRYEQIWACELRGFRVLLLTHTVSRAAALGRLLRAMAPADFVLVTDLATVRQKGLWADIWIEGGKLDAPQLSILGSMVPNPIPQPATHV